MAGETKGKHKQKKAAANLSKKDGSKRPENKTSNPFGSISGGQQRRAKFDIVGRKAKGSTKNMGEAVQKAVAQRQQSLLVEFRQQGKVNSFVDKRFGEKDSSKSEDDKALERFKKERTKRMGKTSRYQLDDGDDGEQLTHMGRALSEVSALGAPSMPQEDEDEDQDEDEAAGRLGADLVSQSHFGGGPLDILAEREKRLARQQEARERAKDTEENRGDKTKRQIMEEIILKSKQHKQEKKVMNAEQMDLVDTLDDSFTDIRNLLEFRNKGKKGSATSGEKAKDEGEDKDSDYAALSNQLAADIKAKAGDRLKTDEEQAKEERLRLETLERERQKRMRMGLEGTADDGDDNELDRALNAATAAATRTVGRPKGILRTNDDELDGNFEVDPQFAARGEEDDEEEFDEEAFDDTKEKGTKRAKEEDAHGKNKRAKKVEFSAKEDRLLAAKEQDILRMQQEVAGAGSSSELSADLSALTDNGLPMVRVKDPLLEADEEDDDEGDEGDQVGEGDWGDDDDDDDQVSAKPAKAPVKTKKEEEKEKDTEKESKKAKTSAPSSPKIITITSKASLAKKAEEAGKKAGLAGEGGAGKTNTSVSLDIPYIIEAPKTFPDFRALIEGRNREETATIIHRIVSSNHISLAAENRQKMERFYMILLQHFHACCNSASTGREVCLGRVDDTAKQLYLLSQMMPHYAGQCMRVHLRQMRTRILASRGTPLAMADLLFFKLIANIFPTSDFRHNVVSPTLVWMGELLTNTPVHGTRDVACLLLLCTLQLHFVRLSRRVLPELFAFLKSLLATACHARGAIPETSEDNLLHTFAETDDLAVDFLSSSQSATSPQPDTPAAVKTESGTSASESEPHQGVKLSLLFSKENPAAAETSPEVRRALLHSTVSVIDQALNIYHNQTQNFPELFDPLFQILAIANKKRDESLSNKQGDKPKSSTKAGKGKVKESKPTAVTVDGEEASLWQRVQELQTRYQDLRKGEVALRKPLVIETAMLPPTIKQFTPEFKETYIPGKDYDPKVERAEMKKFSKKLNREKRGAVRELRRDTEFIAREKGRIQGVKQAKQKEKKKEMRKELEQDQRDTNMFGKMGKKSRGKPRK